MSDHDYDLVVIGAGAGGLTAAKFAAQIGARVALVEKDRLGGDCTWTGCIPSKSLIRAAKVAHDVRVANRFGLVTGPLKVEMGGVQRYLQAVVRAVYEAEPPEALERKGIAVVFGPAEFQDAHVVRVGERTLRAAKCLITTGAHPVIPSVAGLNAVPYVTYQQIFDSDHLPETLLVVGGGPLGMEVAQAYQRLGSRVTVVASRLLPKDDPEAVETMRRVWEREGISFVSGRAISARREGTAIVVATDRTEARGESLLVAAGRAPNVARLALERAGVKFGDEGIPVDDRLRTNVKHIYAAGDVLGGEQFSHVAGWQAFHAARNALLPGTQSGRLNPVTWVTFTDPEVAQVGVTERQARERFGNGINVARWDMSRVDRARCDGDEDGFMKIVTKADGTLVGATIVAARAGEMTGEFSVAIAQQLKIGDVASSIHAYPTYSTGIEQLASEHATRNWVLSAQGRLVRRLMGFTKRPHEMRGRS